MTENAASPSRARRLRLPGVLPGPRGSRLIADPVSGIPLVWLEIAIPGGSAGDPQGCEGFANHLATLARRGAGDRDRRALDDELDHLGASLQVTVDRDAIRLRGHCLRRNLDALLDIAADILARPQMAESEHDKLLRETRMYLDELRDEDVQMAARFFNLCCVPGHPYARSVAGTEASFERIELPAIRAAYARQVVPENLIIGLAGDLGDGKVGDPAIAMAERMAERLVANLPDGKPPALPSLDSPPGPEDRRLVIVDKPERTQSQILVGHMGPRYGTPEALLFGIAETAFGGMFTSRLMQEVRVARGWSYGAGCALHHGRGAHFFRIYLAPSRETTPDALALVLDMMTDLAQSGLRADELEFAKGYLVGSLPFRLATPYQRMRAALEAQLFGIPEDYHELLPQRIETAALDEVNRICRDWLHPERALSVVVATAETMAPALEAVGAGTPRILAYDSY